ncbi:hypothetical protein QBC34DRAFT_387570 [Podospora aff. communis PSN243]|uniref:Myb-like domain-containing protein n=1 Tax=Podospora aff. communis PSN243 TaxID=3040156 RepID=A0AAV9G0A4_9PEZI|nr:hypothetical protein QBC34DRAFT_387570 [Podospora aff. communis PSN243]
MKAAKSNTDSVANARPKFANGRTPLPGHQYPPWWGTKQAATKTGAAAGLATDSGNPAAASGSQRAIVRTTRSGWTDEEARLLFELKDEGKTWREISVRIPRHTKEACLTQYTRLKSRKKKEEQ